MACWIQAETPFGASWESTLMTEESIMTTLWYSTEEEPEEYTDHVTLKDTVTDDEIDDVIYRIMRDVETDHIHYVIQREGSENRYVSVSICRP